jgi:hypothetical protein
VADTTGSNAITNEQAIKNHRNLVGILISGQLPSRLE